MSWALFFAAAAGFGVGVATIIVLSFAFPPDQSDQDSIEGRMLELAERSFDRIAETHSITRSRAIAKMAARTLRANLKPDITDTLE